MNIRIQIQIFSPNWLRVKLIWPAPKSASNYHISIKLSFPVLSEFEKHLYFHVLFLLKAMETSIGENVESMKVNFIAVSRQIKWGGLYFVECNNYPR